MLTMAVKLGLFCICIRTLFRPYQGPRALQHLYQGSFSPILGLQGSFASVLGFLFAHIRALGLFSICIRALLRPHQGSLAALSGFRQGLCRVEGGFRWCLGRVSRKHKRLASICIRDLLRPYQGILCVRNRALWRHAHTQTDTEAHTQTDRFFSILYHLFDNNNIYTNIYIQRAWCCQPPSVGHLAGTHHILQEHNL